MDSQFAYSTDLLPRISAEELSEAIVDYVESIIPPILSEVEAQAPTDVQLRLESLRLKLRSKRMRRNKGTSLIAHQKSRQDFIHYVRDLKQKQVRYHLDEANLPISNWISYDRNTILFKATKSIPVDSVVATSGEIFRDNIVPAESLWNLLTQSARFPDLCNERTTNLTIDHLTHFESDSRFESSLLGDLEKRVQIGGDFTLADLVELKETHNFPSHRSSVSRVDTLVENYANLVRKRTGIDCFAEFLHYEETMPSKLRTRQLKKSTLGLIQAVALYEFRKTARLLGSEFLEGRITYEDYLKKVNENTSLANRIFI